MKNVPTALKCRAVCFFRVGWVCVCWGGGGLLQSEPPGPAVWGTVPDSNSWLRPLIWSTQAEMSSEELQVTGFTAEGAHEHRETKSDWTGTGKLRIIWFSTRRRVTSCGHTARVCVWPPQTHTAKRYPHVKQYSPVLTGQEPAPRSSNSTLRCFGITSRRATWWPLPEAFLRGFKLKLVKLPTTKNYNSNWIKNQDNCDFYLTWAVDGTVGNRSPVNW